MKNIHILPTDKPSRLHNTFNILRLEKGFELSPCNQNIYITNDEEIKVGDWCYQVELNNGKVDKCYDVTLYHTWTNNGVDKTRKFKKIILTTDAELIKDGVQAIDDDFLEWFIKNPSCEEVKVEGINFVDSEIGIIKNHKYKIIIPKEEPKQETLEEVALKWFMTANKREIIFDLGWIKIFEAGAKWQQEQIIDFLHSEITERRDYSSSKMCEKVIEFIEQFKKK